MKSTFQHPDKYYLKLIFGFLVSSGELIDRKTKKMYPFQHLQVFILDICHENTIKSVIKTSAPLIEEYVIVTV